MGVTLPSDQFTLVGRRLPLPALFGWPVTILYNLMGISVAYSVADDRKLEGQSISDLLLRLALPQQRQINTLPSMSGLGCAFWAMAWPLPKPYFIGDRSRVRSSDHGFVPASWWNNM